MWLTKWLDKPKKKKNAWMYFFPGAVYEKSSYYHDLSWFQSESLSCRRGLQVLDSIFTKPQVWLKKIQHVSRLWENRKENEENVVYLTGVRFLFSLFIFSLYVFCLLTAKRITNWRSREKGHSLLTYLKKKPSSGSDVIYLSAVSPLTLGLKPLPEKREKSGEKEIFNNLWE